MKAIMVEDVVRVTSEPTAEALSIFSLRKGDVVDTGKVIRKEKGFLGGGDPPWRAERLHLR